MFFYQVVFNLAVSVSHHLVVRIMVEECITCIIKKKWLSISKRFFFQSMLVTVSEQCEKKLLAVKQEEKSGKTP